MTTAEKITKKRHEVKALLETAREQRRWLAVRRPSDGALVDWRDPAEVANAIYDESGTETKDDVYLWWHWVLADPLKEYERLNAVVNQAVRDADRFRLRLLSGGFTQV